MHFFGINVCGCNAKFYDKKQTEILINIESTKTGIFLNTLAKLAIILIKFEVAS
jgi:hypothetical protein